MERAIYNNMKFTKLQIAAIYKYAQTLMLADGKITKEEENDVIVTFVELCKANGVIAKEMTEASKSMEGSDATAIIKGMNSEQKRYVSATYLVLIAIDKNIDDTEKKLFSLIQILCDLPSLTIHEALEITNFD